jgi:hypothetical protein
MKFGRPISEGLQVHGRWSPCLLLVDMQEHVSEAEPHLTADRKQRTLSTTPREGQINDRGHNF